MKHVEDDFRKAVIEQTLIKKREPVKEKGKPASGTGGESAMSLLEQSLEKRSENSEKERKVDKEVREHVIDHSKMHLIGDLLS